MMRLQRMLQSTRWSSDRRSTRRAPCRWGRPTHTQPCRQPETSCLRPVVVRSSRSATRDVGRRRTAPRMRWTPPSSRPSATAARARSRSWWGSIRARRSPRQATTMEQATNPPLCVAGCRKALRTAHRAPRAAGRFRPSSRPRGATPLETTTPDTRRQSMMRSTARRRPRHPARQPGLAPAPQALGAAMRAPPSAPQIPPKPAAPPHPPTRPTRWRCGPRRRQRRPWPRWRCVCRDHLRTGAAPSPTAMR
mmetsp:Transcript_4082/g.10290  ORF Transcript_4082/g.10290 Transcript_4082/m.10290 type:complete len:250 (+) Transcript_4082:148-897(+)